MTRNKDKILTSLKLATIFCVISVHSAFHPNWGFFLLWLILGEKEKRCFIRNYGFCHQQVLSKFQFGISSLWNQIRYYVNIGFKSWNNDYNSGSIFLTVEEKSIFSLYLTESPFKHGDKLEGTVKIIIILLH